MAQHLRHARRSGPALHVRPPRRRRWLWPAALGGVAASAAVILTLLPRTEGPAAPDPGNPADDPPPAAKPFRAFSGDSWWNTPLPPNAPLDRNGPAILDYLSTAPESGDGCLRLAGAGDSPWGQPVYWAGRGDPSYDVHGVAVSRPPELDSLRIPVSAEPAASDDANMTIFDRGKGYVTLLTDARYDADTDTWSASGATVTYLDSNGLHVGTGLSDNPHNTGSHRGNNGATSVVRWDMVRAGAIPHVLKAASGPEMSDRWVFPMIGSDGDAGAGPAVPPQGLRFRIKPWIDLDSLGLSPQALVIAQALQKYGFYLGDSGGVTALKLEDTAAEGRGQLWNVSSTDLCALPFTPAYWDVIAEGYDPSSER